MSMLGRDHFGNEISKAPDQGSDCANAELQILCPSTNVSCKLILLMWIIQELPKCVQQVFGFHCRCRCWVRDADGG